jgi:hypothetical protein
VIIASCSNRTARAWRLLPRRTGSGTRRHA